MVRNDVTAQVNTDTAHGFDDAEQTSARTVARTMLIAAAACYGVSLLVLGFVLGWAFALLVALWPAAFVGPMIGGFAALARPTADKPLAAVASLAPPSSSAAVRDAA